LNNELEIMVVGNNGGLISGTVPEIARRTKENNDKLQLK
jgi:hypothetical protein